MSPDRTTAALAMMALAALAVVLIAILPVLDWHWRQRIAHPPASDNRSREADRV